jgi:hypothetical protein
MDTRPRRITLADALVLIAAVAVGLGIARLEIEWYGHQALASGAESIVQQVFMSLRWAGLVVMVALIPLRLRRPRPPVRRVRRQPGFIACFAVVLGMAWFGLFCASILLKRSSMLPSVSLNILWWISSPSSVGAEIATAWVILAVSGRCRPEPSWIDRSGRILGIAWIIGYFLELVFRALP